MFSSINLNDELNQQRWLVPPEGIISRFHWQYKTTEMNK
jgi:hypothetical protein